MFIHPKMGSPWLCPKSLHACFEGLGHQKAFLTLEILSEHVPVNPSQWFSGTHSFSLVFWWPPLKVVFPKKGSFFSRVTEQLSLSLRKLAFCHLAGSTPWSAGKAPRLLLHSLLSCLLPTLFSQLLCPRLAALFSPLLCPLFSPPFAQPFLSLFSPRCSALLNLALIALCRDFCSLFLELAFCPEDAGTRGCSSALAAVPSSCEVPPQPASPLLRC